MRAGRQPSILHVFPSFARGGQQMRLAAIVAALAGEFHHRILSLDGDLSARSALGDIDVAAFETQKTGGVSASSVARLAGEIRRSEAQLLCTYNFGSVEAVLANALGPRLPHIHHEDGFGPDEAPERQKLRRVLVRMLALRGSLTVVPSRLLETVAVERWRLPRQRVKRIPNGIDVEKFAGAAKARREGAKVVVGSVGALRAEKNYERLLRCLPPEVRLFLYGDGPERDKLRSLAGEAGDRVTLKGATTTPERAYAEFDIFALSSDTEQMPLSLMEAMAAGLPVVATDVGDVRAMVAPANHPFICATGDEAGFASALSTLARDPALRGRAGEANAEKARREFALADMVAAHAALYRSLAVRAAA